jgi:hypothetical protein
MIFMKINKSHKLRNIQVYFISLFFFYTKTSLFSYKINSLKVEIKNRISIKIFYLIFNYFVIILFINILYFRILFKKYLNSSQTINLKSRKIQSQ